MHSFWCIVCLHFVNFCIWDCKGNFILSLSCLQDSRCLRPNLLLTSHAAPFSCQLLLLCTKIIQTFEFYSIMEYKMKKSFLYTCNAPPLFLILYLLLQKTIMNNLVYISCFGEKGSLCYLCCIVIFYFCRKVWSYSVFFLELAFIHYLIYIRYISMLVYVDLSNF